MLLTTEQATERLNSKNNLANRFSAAARSGEVNVGAVVEVEIESIPETKETPQSQVIELTAKRQGKHSGVHFLDREMRTEIAFRARAGENQIPLAKEYGVDQSHVAKLELGQCKGIDEEAIEQRLNQIKDTALLKLMGTMNLITEEKLESCGAQALSAIAGNFAKVIEKISPKDKASQQTNIIIYQPELRKESSFQTVEIG